MDFVGKAHRCIPNIATVVKNSDDMANAPVTNVTNSVTNNKDVERVQRWRKNNSDQYKTYQREYMRKRRAAQKAHAAV